MRENEIFHRPGKRLASVADGANEGYAMIAGNSLALASALEGKMRA